ncbi:MAG TPA: hypothetical protein VGV93_04890 [Acidimicrobiales bacterium]|nr:hypothetical protein [Acidimicrobiales bacterium]
MEDTPKSPFQDRDAVPVVSVDVGDVSRPDEGVPTCSIPGKATAGFSLEGWLQLAASAPGRRKWSVRELSSTA